MPFQRTLDQLDFAFLPSIYGRRGRGQQQPHAGHRATPHRDGHPQGRGLHIEDRYVKVLGKGDKERIVGFGVACQRALVHYEYHFRVEPAHPGIDAFFLCIDGRPMTPDALRSLTTRLPRMSQVPKLHPHLLRHTYDTDYLVNGGDVFSLKQNLGHTTMAMVEHYVHLASQRVALISRDFSPLTGTKRPAAGVTVTDSTRKHQGADLLQRRAAVDPGAPW